MSRAIRDIVMPDLDMPDVQPTISVWLVRLGAKVTTGDRLVEVLAGDAAIDLSAPVTGIFVEKCIGEDEPVNPGQVLGRVEAR
jgi:pyruvate/2-oxoglutarate dehydrogenase complex dihydrolipoamide acyltransferase (E2) component